MSVRKGERTQGKLEVLSLSVNLCVYTLNLCKSEKIFPKSQRWLLTSKIANEAVDTLACIRRANAVLLSESPTIDREYGYRRAQQIEAHSHIGALLSLIDIAYQMNGIEEKRIAFWTQLAIQTDDKLKAWMRSDKERYIKLKPKARA